MIPAGNAYSVMGRSYSKGQGGGRAGTGKPLRRKSVDTARPGTRTCSGQFSAAADTVVKTEKDCGEGVTWALQSHWRPERCGTLYGLVDLWRSANGDRNRIYFSTSTNAAIDGLPRDGYFLAARGS